jgi:hypothetical protein
MEAPHAERRRVRNNALRHHSRRGCPRDSHGGSPDTHPHRHDTVHHGDADPAHRASRLFEHLRDHRPLAPDICGGIRWQRPNVPRRSDSTRSKAVSGQSAKGITTAEHAISSPLSRPSRQRRRARATPSQNLSAGRLASGPAGKLALRSDSAAKSRRPVNTGGASIGVDCWARMT